MLSTPEPKTKKYEDDKKYSCDAFNRMEQASLLEHSEDVPVHVTVHYDKQKRKVYIDHENETTSWENPNLPPLAPGWSITHDTSGEIMYIELRTLTMTYIRPNW